MWRVSNPLSPHSVALLDLLRIMDLQQLIPPSIAISLATCYTYPSPNLMWLMSSTNWSSTRMHQLKLIGLLPNAYCSTSNTPQTIYGLLLHRSHSLHLLPTQMLIRQAIGMIAFPFPHVYSLQMRTQCALKSSEQLSTHLLKQSIALSSGTTKIAWVTILLELCCPLPKPSCLLCDNIDVMYLCVNLVFHSKMKHIALDYHFGLTGSLQVARVYSQSNC